MKVEIIQELVNRCEQRLLLAQKNNDTQDYKLYQTITKLLNIENIFEYLSFEQAVNVLKDLGYENKEVIELYKKIIKN